MKKITLTITAGFLFFNLLLAHTGDPKVPTKTAKTEVNISLNDIFLSDYDGLTLFVDFEAITDDVLTVNVKQDGALIMSDDVQDLPCTTIYELDLEQMKPGNYSVELKTAQGITIQKDLLVGGE